MLIAVLVLFACPSALASSEEMNRLWLTYVKTYGKDYIDTNEEIYRRGVWEENTEYISKHNMRFDLGLESFTLGINEYSDLTFEEYKKIFLVEVQPISDEFSNETKPTHTGQESTNFPLTVDWRTKGYVTDVKNQGRCGSCWAFAATGTLEGQTYRKFKKLVSLSEQNLMDCSKNYGNKGCEGGNAIDALKYVRENKGIASEAAYPYNAKSGSICWYEGSQKAASCFGFRRVPSSEADLMAAVAEVGPIAVSIDATHRSFHHYRGGVYNEPGCSRTKTSHAVLVVGYGTYGGQQYWLVKNSWGTSWGMKGYIMMSRNKESQCAIALRPVYPIV